MHTQLVKQPWALEEGKLRQESQLGEGKGWAARRLQVQPPPDAGTPANPNSRLWNASYSF